MAGAVLSEDEEGSIQGMKVQSVTREGGVCGGKGEGRDWSETRGRVGDIMGRRGQESSVPESSSS